MDKSTPLGLVIVLAVSGVFLSVSEAFNWNENVAPKLRVNYLSSQASGKNSFKRFWFKTVNYFSAANLINNLRILNCIMAII